MLTWLTTGNPPENVKDYVSVMDDRQYNLYLCMTEQFQELLHVSNRSYFLLAAGTRPLWRGDYEKAAICFQRGMDQAYREGSLRILMKCCGNLGTCYSCESAGENPGMLCRCQPDGPKPGASEGHGHYGL